LNKNGKNIFEIYSKIWFLYDKINFNYGAGGVKMEEKIFDLLEKLFIQQNEMKEDLQGQISKLELKVEHQISNKIDALFEFRDMTNESLERIENKIDILHEKVDNHELRIKVIEGGRKKTS